MADAATKFTVIPPKEEKKRLLSPISDIELMATDVPPVKWIINGLLPEGFSALVAHPKIGKSMFALSLAHSVASGTFAFSNPEFSVPQPYEVLMVAGEDSLGRLKTRLGSIQKYDGPTGNLYLATQMSKFGQGGFEEIGWWCEEHKNRGLVIVDTLTNFKIPSSGTGTQFEADRADYDAYNKFAEQYGISLLVIHHNKKGEGDDPLQQGSGTMGLASSVSAYIALSRGREGNEGTMYITGRDIPQRTYDAHFYPEDALWKITEESMGDNRRPREERRIYMDYLEKHPWSNPKEIAKGLGRLENGKVPSSVYNMLKRMVDDGDLILDGRKYDIVNRNGRPILPDFS